LFGESADDFERLDRAGKKSTGTKPDHCIKRSLYLIAMPGGKAYFNTTGNPGMATAEAEIC